MQTGFRCHGGVAIGRKEVWDHVAHDVGSVAKCKIRSKNKKTKPIGIRENSFAAHKNWIKKNVLEKKPARRLGYATKMRGINGRGGTGDGSNCSLVVSFTPKLRLRLKMPTPCYGLGLRNFGFHSISCNTDSEPVRKKIAQKKITDSDVLVVHFALTYSGQNNAGGKNRQMNISANIEFATMNSIYLPLQQSGVPWTSNHSA